MTIKAVVFDWAGTTIDYGSRAPIIGFQAAFERFGVHLDEATIRQDVGLDKKAHVKKMLQDPDVWAKYVKQAPASTLEQAVASVYAAFQETIQAALTQTADLKPGVAAFLNYLDEKRILVATTSGYNQAMIQTLLPLVKKQGFQPTVNVTSELTSGVGRPAGDMLSYALKQLGVDDPASVMKIGDTVNDIKEANNAGAIAVGVVVGSNLIGMSETEFVCLDKLEQARLIADASGKFYEAGADHVVASMADVMPLIEHLNQEAARKQAPLLLTPGPLTTSVGVKAVMQVDHGTWDDEYKEMTQRIRQQLLTLAHADTDKYTTVLVQGSGSYGVEATLETIPKTKAAVVLIAINGAYGQRMSEIADRIGVNHVDLQFEETEPVDPARVAAFLKDHPEVTHFAVVQGETTTGILNPIETLIPAMAEKGIVTIVDAMSTFGGVPIDVDQLRVDYLISSANKCVQGVPGFAFVIARAAQLATTEGHARSLSLDLYDQWRCFEDHAGKWRFTSPTHVVYAFEQALLELNQEGGVPARTARYGENETVLRRRMMAAGFEPILESSVQSPIITAFKYPSDDFDFRDFYLYLKERGFIIYPGKVSKMNSFRIGNIGEIYPADIDRLVDLISTYVSAPVHS